jgi:CheY-like chemotaxis protein
MSQRTIYLAEDDPQEVELVLGSLKARKMTNAIVVVNDGTRVLDHFCRRDISPLSHPVNPIVVLLDLNNPECHGLEVLQILEKDPQLKETPVVLLTTSGKDIDVAECCQLSNNARTNNPVSV